MGGDADRDDLGVDQVRDAAADDRVGADEESEQHRVQRQHRTDRADRDRDLPVVGPAVAEHPGGGTVTSARNVSAPPASTIPRNCSQASSSGATGIPTPLGGRRSDRFGADAEAERALGHVAVVGRDHPPADRVAAFRSGAQRHRHGRVR